MDTQAKSRAAPTEAPRGSLRSCEDPLLYRAAVPTGEACGHGSKSVSHPAAMAVRNRPSTGKLCFSLSPSTDEYLSSCLITATVLSNRRGAGRGAAEAVVFRRLIARLPAALFLRRADCASGAGGGCRCCVHSGHPGAIMARPAVPPPRRCCAYLMEGLATSTACQASFSRTCASLCLRDDA